jgi:hypothetical protein
VRWCEVEDEGYGLDHGAAVDLIRRLSRLRWVYMASHLSQRQRVPFHAI